ncbi:MAG: tRNA glutamyl-Q(34) synthetase GluQRS [Verrucomicrobiota bacterium]
MNIYRGRIAPSPTGLLHLGHARTFWTAQQRTRENHGQLILRNEDLDFARCKPEFVVAMFEDLRWFGFQRSEGPDVGGRFAPYSQSERTDFYRAAFEKLRERGLIYPCFCSRKDIQRAATAPHAEDDEPIYPGTCRGNAEPGTGNAESQNTFSAFPVPGSAFNWRFRIPDGEIVSFLDGNFGEQKFVAGKDFGDFIVWRHDGIPAYQLAVTVDDAAMEISEVVRGTDLLVSTARQTLLYRALKLSVPKFFHCPLMTDEKGIRLAKRHDVLSLRTLREKGIQPEDLRAVWK